MKKFVHEITNIRFVNNEDGSFSAIGDWKGEIIEVGKAAYLWILESSFKEGDTIKLRLWKDLSAFKYRG